MRGSDESAGHRHARLEELILEELRGLFRDDVSDPALAAVRVARLVLSVDYRHARVHYVMVGARESTRDAVRHVDQRLRVATPFLRSRLGDALDLRRVPDLAFVFDAATPDDPPRDVG